MASAKEHENWIVFAVKVAMFVLIFIALKFQNLEAVVDDCESHAPMPQGTLRLTRNLVPSVWAWNENQRTHAKPALLCLHRTNRWDHF